MWVWMNTTIKDSVIITPAMKLPSQPIKTVQSWWGLPGPAITRLYKKLRISHAVAPKVTTRTRQLSFGMANSQKKNSTSLVWVKFLKVVRLMVQNFARDVATGSFEIKITNYNFENLRKWLQKFCHGLLKNRFAKKREKCNYEFSWLRCNNNHDYGSRSQIFGPISIRRGFKKWKSLN